MARHAEGPGGFILAGALRIDPVEGQESDYGASTIFCVAVPAEVSRR